MKFETSLPRIVVLNILAVIATGTGSMAHAANYDCDTLMKGLLKQSGGCQGNNCKYNVVNGSLVGFNGGVVNKDDGSTEMKSVSSATKDSNGVSSVRIEAGKDGAYRMLMSVVDDKGRTTKSEYGFTAKDGTCIHEQTERKNPNDLASSVEYDREFCDAAAKAYEGLSAEQAKTCDDLLKNLVGKFEERTNALAKDRKAFSSATATETINAKMLANNGDSKSGQGKLIQALKQKDQCAKATVEVNSARPLDFRQRYGRLFDANPIRGEYFEYIDKRAWPLKNFNKQNTTK